MSLLCEGIHITAEIPREVLYRNINIDCHYTFISILYLTCGKLKQALPMAQPLSGDPITTPTWPPPTLKPGIINTPLFVMYISLFVNVMTNST